jgi:hypothetical protein
MNSDAEIIERVYKSIDSFVPEPDAHDCVNDTPVIAGVLLWLEDMGILDGDIDDVFPRIEDHVGFARERWSPSGGDKKRDAKSG